MKKVRKLFDFISDSTCLICDYECIKKSEIIKHIQTEHLDIISTSSMTKNVENNFSEEKEESVAILD